MQSKPGTYVLLLESRSAAMVEVGRWGQLRLQPGYYAYVGSAFGPGGIKARVARHCRSKKRMHWHLDYLRSHLTPLAAWCSYSPNRLEHDWALTLAAETAFSPIKAFGSSDCSCISHLFYMPARMDLQQLLNAAREAANDCHYVAL